MSNHHQPTQDHIENASLPSGQFCHSKERHPATVSARITNAVCPPLTWNSHSLPKSILCATCAVGQAGTGWPPIPRPASYGSQPVHLCMGMHEVRPTPSSSLRPPWLPCSCRQEWWWWWWCRDLPTPIPSAQPCDPHLPPCLVVSRAGPYRGSGSSRSTCSVLPLDPDTTVQFMCTLYPPGPWAACPGLAPAQPSPAPLSLTGPEPQPCSAAAWASAAAACLLSLAALQDAGLLPVL